MKDNELRIGNLVIYGGSVVKMNLREFTHFLRSPETYTPITLTEEILLKCGFEKREDGDYNLFKNSEVDIVICSDFNSWKCDGINFSVNYIKHLHQLQNLYFALTGEDLEINI
ncbi:hypothetical protein HXZ94_15690 [Empedobacter falsenii]|uniref:hypothetical protein n=1 Tax=Empedobacter falsenii TaxID=343874 RepID=UPI00257742C9|nr:hypothetical protein [Empedobacter falsenii]MDM1299938.1 hypothetical protein [Empedobacter falsenii]MDM1319731.1 hypothetical protein [Empedobacter falsenii]